MEAACAPNGVPTAPSSAGPSSLHPPSGAPVAPSRSTVYVSNLPFSLTNTDIYKIFDKFGKLVKVTIMRDKDTRRSRGVAFLLFLTRPQALACVAATNNCVMFDRTLSAHMARDNGKAAEFVRRREYPDKSRCYECGEFGHLSYSCPKNTLGTREPPKKKTKTKKRPSEQADATSKKRKKKKKSVADGNGDDEDVDDDEEEPEFEDESLSGAIRYMQELREAELVVSAPSGVGRRTVGSDKEQQQTKKAYKPSAYFSDEEELE